MAEELAAAVRLAMVVVVAEVGVTLAVVVVVAVGEEVVHRPRQLEPMP